MVVSNLNPKLLFERLVDQTHLPGDFRERIARYRNGSATFRMNVAIDRLPRFTCLPEAGDHLTAGIIMAPSLGYMDRAYRDARGHGLVARADHRDADPFDAGWQPCAARQACREPVLPAHGAGGFRRLGSASREVADLMIETVDRYAPGFNASVIGRQVLSPLDLERTFGLVGGDIFHAAL